MFCSGVVEKVSLPEVGLGNCARFIGCQDASAVAGAVFGTVFYALGQEIAIGRRLRRYSNRIALGNSGAVLLASLGRVSDVGRED